MSLPHAHSGDVIALKPLGAGLPQATSTAIVRTPHLELIRSVLHKGRTVLEHTVAGDLTIQCIEGKLAVQAHGMTTMLLPGELLFLAGGVPHSIAADEDSSALLTLVRVAAK